MVKCCLEEMILWRGVDKYLNVIAILWKTLVYVCLHFFLQIYQCKKCGRRISIDISSKSAFIAVYCCLHCIAAIIEVIARNVGVGLEKRIHKLITQISAHIHTHIWVVQNKSFKTFFFIWHECCCHIRSPCCWYWPT